MGWKNLKSWVKGGIIGFILPLLVFILSYSNPPFLIHGLLTVLGIFFILPLIPFFPRFPYVSVGDGMYLGAVILWTLIGILIGFIIDKRRKRKLEKLSSGTSKGV